MANTDMDRYNKIMKDALDAARSHDWDRAIQLGRQVPRSWDVWQQFPSVAKGPDGTGPGMPDGAIHRVLDILKSGDKDSFLFELSSNLPANTSAETLNRIAHEGRDDYYVTENVASHPNFKLDPHEQAMKDASDFWATYETSVEPHHFATVKSMFSGKPEELVDHRGRTGSSHEHMPLIPSMHVYAKEVQNAVLKQARDMDHKIRYFGDQAHIKVYRGVGGEYARQLMDAAKYDHKTGEVDAKNLKIPVSHLTSWSTDPELAHRFATSRATDSQLHNKPEHQVGVIMEKWLPVKDILHSGQHTVVSGQEHPHPGESELVFGHKEPHVTVPTTGLHFLKRPDPSDGFQYPWPSAKGVARQKIKKSEDPFSLGDEQLEHWENEMAFRMLGNSHDIDKIMAAAKILSNGKFDADMERYRLAMKVYSDPQRAALYAFHIADNDKNVRALKALIEIGGDDLAKAEKPKISSVRAVFPEGQKTAEAVLRAVHAGQIFPLNLSGKHAQGALAARDPRTGHVWLLKPGSGRQSPAAGARQEKASQSRREAAAWQVAIEFDIYRSLPHCDLLLIDDSGEWAAMGLLGPKFEALDDKNREIKNYAQKALRPFLDNTMLHRWAIFDFVIGNPDRHMQNIMINPSGDIALIDHGSAFAGTDFNPVDKNSFVPGYLRVWGPDDFSHLTPEQRYAYMPTLNKAQEAELRQWFDSIEPSKIDAILKKYGIDPKASMSRMKFLRDVSGSLSAAVNRAFAGVSPT